MSDEKDTIAALVARVRALENPPKPNGEPILLSIKQVAHRLQVSPDTVRRLKLPVYKIRHSIRYKSEDVDKYVNRCVEYPIPPRKTERPRNQAVAFVTLPTWEEAQATLEARRKGK